MDIDIKDKGLLSRMGVLPHLTLHVYDKVRKAVFVIYQYDRSYTLLLINCYGHALSSSAKTFIFVEPQETAVYSYFNLLCFV